MKREVIDGFQAVSGRNHLTTPGLAFALIESKFHPPGVRPGIVVRTAVVERLAATRVPVITVAAPPGYGKTTLMSQWAERIGSQAAGTPPKSRARARFAPPTTAAFAWRCTKSRR